MPMPLIAHIDATQPTPAQRTQKQRLNKALLGETNVGNKPFMRAYLWGGYVRGG